MIAECFGVFLSTPGTVCTVFVQQTDQPISGRQAWSFPARNATIVMFFGSSLESTVWQNEAVVGVLFGFTGRQSVLFGLKILLSPQSRCAAFGGDPLAVVSRKPVCTSVVANQQTLIIGSYKGVSED